MRKEKVKEILKQIFLFIVQIAFSRAVIGYICPLGFSFALARIFLGSNLFLVTVEYAVSKVFIWSNFYLILSVAYEIVIISLYYFFKEMVKTRRKYLCVYLFLFLSSMIKVYFVLTDRLNLLSLALETGLRCIALIYFLKLHDIYQKKFVFLKCSNLDYLMFSVFVTLFILGLFQYEILLSSIGLCLFFASLIISCRFLPSDKFLLFAMTIVLCFAYAYSSSRLVILSVLSLIFLVPFSRIYKYLYLSVVLAGFYLIFRFNNLLSITNIVSALSSVLLCALLPQKLVNQLSQFFEEKNLDIIKENLWHESQMEIKTKLATMSKTLSKMQEEFKFLIVGKIDRKIASEELAKDVMCKCCNACERNIICNNSLIDKQNVLSEFIYHAVSKGSFYPDELSVGFRTYCVKTSLIANKIAELAEQYLAFEAKVKSEDESKLLISDELGNFARLFQNFAQNVDKTPKINKNLSNLLQEVLTNSMIDVVDVAVFENLNSIEKIDIVAQNSVMLRRELVDVIGRFVNQKVQIKKLKHLNYSGLSYISFSIANALKIEFAVSSSSKESVSGDNTLISKIDDNRFLIALADGMGHGRLAGKTSQMILDLIKNMFLVGINLDVIIESVNKLLIPIGLDNFSTLDIVVVDLRLCKCSFIKLGSSVSLIKHKQQTDIVVSSSLPVGIVQNLKPSVETYSIRGDDVIVLASDGVVDSFNEINDYKIFINDYKIGALQKFTDNIIFELSNKPNEHRDDMSIIALKLLKNSYK